MDRRYLFLLTYGRTGSTLLQGILNTFDGVAIFGENAGCLLGFMQAFAALESAHSHLPSNILEKKTAAWYGASRYSRETLIANFRSVINQLIFDRMPDGSENLARVVGFKEIRHLFIGKGQIDNYVNFLELVFPNVFFVFLERNIDEVLSSGWWSQNNPRSARLEIEQFIRFVHTYSKAHPERTLLVHYDELGPAGTAYTRMARFLGLQENWDAYRLAISSSHSYDNRNLTRLLRADDQAVSLLDHSWWRANIEEFSVDVEYPGGVPTVTGVLLFRASAIESKILVDVDGETIPLPIDHESLDLSRRFKFNPRAANAKFRVQLPGACQGTVTFKRANDEVAIATIRRKRCFDPTLLLRA
jgi:hypothetical protein